MSLQHLILGQLNVQPMTGYELNQAFENSVTHFWTTDQSQIYRALHKLHESGLVDLEIIHQDNLPDRKVYSITESGRRSLTSWLAAPIQSNTSRLPELGQVYFGAALDPPELLQLIEIYIAEGKEFQKQYEALKMSLPLDRIDEMPYEAQLPLMTLVYGLQRMEFELEWWGSLAEIVRNRLNDDEISNE